VLAGDHEAALTLAQELERRVLRLGETAPLVAVFDRLVGYALCQAGQVRAGWSRLGTSLLRNRENGVEYQAALSLHALGRVGRLLDAPGVETLTEEAQAIFDRLGVVRVPEVPLPAAASLG